VPSKTDFDHLKDRSSANELRSAWGGVYGGVARGASVEYAGSFNAYWSSSESGTNAYVVRYGGGYLDVFYTVKHDGYQVRCVK
jgi:hypothetical protein